MLSFETESCLSRLLLNLASGERSVEITRQVLAQNLDFDPYQVFCVLDREGKNSIDSINIVEFLQKNGVCSNTADVDFMILFYDENADGLLSYSEFLNMILSDTNYSLRRLARDRVGCTMPRLSLVFNVEYSIARLLEKELELVRTTRAYIEDIRRRYDFNPHDIYHLLKGCGPITQESLRYFLERCNAPHSYEDLKAIMKRMDFNKDGQVTFEEFHCFLTYPQCLHCCCYHHHCCCGVVKSCSPVRHDIMNKTMSLNMSSSFQKPQDFISSISQMNKYTPEGKNRFESSMNNQEAQRVSQNLSLRLSPERKFSPKNSPQRMSPIRESRIISHSPHHHYSPVRHCSPHHSPVRHCSPHHSPVRHCSPHHSPIRHCSPHHSPVRHCSPHHSPVRHCSPHHSPLRCVPVCHTICCLVCHCSPCCCCKIAYESGERVFLTYFTELMGMEKQVERAKIDLALRSDFNIEDAFRIFELDGRGYISETDLKYGLSQLDIFASQSDIKLIMRRTDIRKNGIINFADFFDLVTPFEKDYRTMVEKRRPSSYSPQFNKADVFLLGTKIYLQALLRLIISTENKLENLKCGLREAREQIKNIYETISRGCCTFSEMDMSSYLRMKGVLVTEQESGLGFIRLDRNRNGKIELWELQEELNTMS